MLNEWSNIYMILFLWIPVVIAKIHHHRPYHDQCSSVQSLSCLRFFVTPWTAALQASLSNHQLPELIQTHVHRINDATQPSHPLSSPFPLAINIFPHQCLFQWVSSSHQVSKILEFQLQQQYFQWIFRTDFLRRDWLDLLAVQGTLKSLLQHHNSKASILWHSAFFLVQFTYSCMTTGKSIDFTRWIVVGKVMSLLFNMLSRLDILYLPGSKYLLISGLHSPSAMILEPSPDKKKKICHCSHCFHIYFPWSDGTKCHDFSFWMLSFKLTFSLSSFTFIKRLFSSSSLSV